MGTPTVIAPLIMYEKGLTGRNNFADSVQGSPLYCSRECKLVQPLWKPVWRFLKKLKIELPYNPAIPLFEIHPKQKQTH